jgi:intracellular multiplication protein IcmE
MIDDENNADIDGGSDNFDEGAVQRSSLKEMWESNPLLKITAAIVGVIVLGIAFFTLTGGKEEEKNISVVAATATTKVTPGQQNVDEEYRKAIEDQNKKRAEDALNTGVSAMPTPIGTSKLGGIDVPDAPAQAQEDPLKEWRQRTEARRVLQQETLPAEEVEPPAPEVVPMVQPIRPQQQPVVMKMDPKEAQALAKQMMTIIQAQAPEAAEAQEVTKEISPYIVQREKEKAAGGLNGQGALTGGNQNASGNKPEDGANLDVAEKKTIIAAGTISYAQLLNELNSDIQGPALAQVLSGPFEGGRALGSFQVQDEYLVLTFKTIVKDGVSYSVDGIALNEKTTLTGHQTDVDYHYFSRVILPAAAAFVEGYGAAVAETGTSTEVTNGGGAVQETPEPSEKEQLYAGLEESSSKVAEILDERADRPITVIVAKGTTMGILFMDAVTTADAGK